MSRFLGLLALLLCLSSGLWAQKTAEEIFKNPIAQKLMAEAVERYLPQVTGKNEQVKGLSLVKVKEQGDVVDYRINVVFKNPKAALGNGNYRIKLKMGKKLFPPKIYTLKMQTFRIWFIRFYKKVI